MSGRWPTKTIWCAACWRARRRSRSSAPRQIPSRASHYVMAYLQSKGYRTIPVNPHAAGLEINGEKVYSRLADVPAPVDMVDVFRNSSAAARRRRRGDRREGTPRHQVHLDATRRPQRRGGAAGGGRGHRRGHGSLSEDRIPAPVRCGPPLDNRRRSAVDGEFDEIAIRVAKVDRHHWSDRADACYRSACDGHLTGAQMLQNLARSTRMRRSKGRPSQALGAVLAARLQIRSDAG